MRDDQARRTGAADRVFRSDAFLRLWEPAQVVYRELREVFVEQRLPCILIPTRDLPAVVRQGLDELVREGWLVEMEAADGDARLFFAAEGRDPVLWEESSAWPVPLDPARVERFRAHVERGWSCEESLSGTPADDYRRACVLLEQSITSEGVDLAKVARGMIVLRRAVEAMDADENPAESPGSKLPS